MTCPRSLPFVPQTKRHSSRDSEFPSIYAYFGRMTKRGRVRVGDGCPCYGLFLPDFFAAAQRFRNALPSRR
jgi:hypothetical protein